MSSNHCFRFHDEELTTCEECCAAICGLCDADDAVFGNGGEPDYCSQECFASATGSAIDHAYEEGRERV